MKSTPIATLRRFLVSFFPSSRALGCAFFLGSSLVSLANSVTLTFDTIDATGGAVDATAYLGSYGITLSAVSPTGGAIYTGAVGIWDDRVMPYEQASSGHNFLLQQTAGSPANTYTLNFGTALESLSFTRIQNTTYNLVAGWTATAYIGTTALSSVGEGYGLGAFSPTTYNFTGSGITSLVISANGYGQAGIASVMIDDMVLTTHDSVPDSASTLGLTGIAIVGMLSLRRRFAK